MRGEWAGDEDLGSGAVQLLHKEYRSRCQSVRQLGVIAQKLVELTSDMENDLVFLVEGEKMAKKEYAKAIEISGKRESTLMELAWNVTGFERLIEQGNGFINKLTNFMEHIKMGEPNKVTESLHCFKTSALQYLRELYTKKRLPASHHLIFMISDESRNRKPYANPVRFLPYHSLTDAKLRDLEVESDMKSLGMNVVGKYYLFAHLRKYMYSVYCKYMCSQLGHYYFCIKGFLQMANSIHCGQMVKKGLYLP